MDNHIIHEQAMNSLQIADLVQSRHDSVKRTIERLADQEIITLPPMVETSFIDKIGKIQHTTAYLFTGEQGKLDSITVVAQLCPQFTAAIVKRWQELERQIAMPPAPVFSALEMHMATLAQGMNMLLTQNNLTHRYIALLEMNQKGKRRIKREDEAIIRELRDEGMSQADIARLLRISPASVNLILKGRYPFSKDEIARAETDVQACLEKMLAREHAKVHEPPQEALHDEMSERTFYFIDNDKEEG